MAVGPKANSGESASACRLDSGMVSIEAVHRPIGWSPMVCVVDDDESLLRALRRLLDATGFRVETFSSAEKFLGSEHRTRADCLVLDVHLGGLSGLDLQEQLATSGVRTPVVIITAHDDRRTRERAQRAGAVEYLRKPFDDESLIDAIHRAIGEG
jgi:FixJ family two-component response regulator